MLELELLGYKIKLELNKNTENDDKIFFKRYSGEVSEIKGFYATTGILNEIFENDEDKMRVVLIWIVHNLAIKGGNNLDYLQNAEINGTRIWIIDDGEKITFLLPSEY